MVGWEGEGKDRAMFETTVAGSLPKPAWLAEPEKLWAPWRMQGEALDRAKRDAVLVWLKLQETAGIDIVTDGEQFRVHFVHGFLEHVEGIDWEHKTKMGIRADRYVVDVPQVTGPVSRPRPVHAEEVRFTRAHTDRKLKFTLPGPMTICDTIADAHYGSRADMAMAFAEILNAEAKELAAAGVDGEAGARLLEAFPDPGTAVTSGKLYVVDPLGNLMMSYPGDAPPKSILTDLERLLKLSHIG